MKATKHHPLAAAMRLALLSAARSRGTVTYGRLMKTYHLSRGRRLSQTIGEVDRVEYSRGAPGFAAIIVRKDTGFPGGGYFVDDALPPGLRRARGRGNNPRLSSAERRHVLEQQRKIWEYYSTDARA
jgi:hypothetical protein